ncbi:MAG: cytochrome c3 family protein [Thermoanaerobaculales bacterium]
MASPRIATHTRSRGPFLSILVVAAGILAIVAATSQASVGEKLCGRDEIRVVEGRTFVMAAGGVVEVRDVTTACAGCHDGTVASSVLHRSNEDRQQQPKGWFPESAAGPGGLRNDHSVDVLYPVGHPEFTPVGDLDPRLNLATGRVTCLTCHADAEAPSRLTISNSKSRLCLSCHRK